MINKYSIGVRQKRMAERVKNILKSNWEDHNG